MTNEEIRIAIGKSLGLLENPKVKPTIAELEAILDDPSPKKITILPSGEVHALPDYTEDANASLQLIDKLAEGGFVFDIHHERECPWVAHFVKTSNGETLARCHASETFPLAVAGAYLKVLNLWTEEGA